ncbi:MAG: FkbM family methyltransferase [Thiobacillaceae bacterium]
MTDVFNILKRAYWMGRENYASWRKHSRPGDIRRRAVLRLRAWLQPVIEIEGIRLYRGTGLTIPVLETLEARQYETPEARIVRHAIQPADVVLELGTGLGFLASLCAKVVGSDKVYSYEANPALAPVIQRNFKLNGVSPRLEISLLGGENGAITFYVMKNFWSSSTIKRHPRAKPIQVPMKRFNDELTRLRPSFLIIDIEGGEQDFIHYARLDGLQKVCIELHPHVIGQAAVAEVEAFFIGQGFREDPAVSDPEHKLYLRDPR